MSLRLKLAPFLITERVLLRELRGVDRLTTSALEALVLRHAPDGATKLRPREFDYDTIEEGRRRMAEGHNQLIRLLIESIGRQMTIEMGRGVMYQVGRSVGQDMRMRMRVRNEFKDLERAARILYTVLGIHFRIEGDGEERKMIVDRCSLAGWYTPESCLIMSAADEGVVSGLCPGIEMRFRERMTGDASECLAVIRGTDL